MTIMLHDGNLYLVKKIFFSINWDCWGNWAEVNHNEQNWSQAVCFLSVYLPVYLPHSLTVCLCSGSVTSSTGRLSNTAEATMLASVPSAACACHSWTHKLVWHRTTATSGWKHATASQVIYWTNSCHSCGLQWTVYTVRYGSIWTATQIL